MFGAVAKTYLAEKLDVKPEDMIVVSVMPCVAKNTSLLDQSLVMVELKMLI